MEPIQAMRTLQKKRTSNFREDETKLLIHLWGSSTIQNKLYLTHRKAPVMRLLAAGMQQRGFYRTPDEIKTRIRNLKCLYHRIKRTMQSGSGIGTVDPDWPHFKAMDEILTRQGQKKNNLYKDNVFEGPRCEDIKQEIDDIDINDDMESYTSNSIAESEYEDESTSMPPLTPAPASEPKKDAPLKILPQIKPSFTTVPISTASVSNASNVGNVGIRAAAPTIPFPLLILNGMPAQTISGDKRDALGTSGGGTNISQDISGILKELLEVQKEHLATEKERLELEKQKIEYQRVVGTQLLQMGSLLGCLFDRLPIFGSDLNSSNESPSPESPKNGRKRNLSDHEVFKKSHKLLRTALEQGGKKNTKKEDSDDDSGIQNDDLILNK